MFRVGSAEELEDLKAAYLESEGVIDTIMQYIPHSTFDDEVRFICIITDLIKHGHLPSLEKWKKSVKDEKGKLVRRKKGEAEAKEAEDLAKELGVWDEFYGSGKAAPKTGKGKGRAKANEEEDHSALQALILKRKKNPGSFFDNLAAKYADMGEKPKGRRKGKKRAKGEEEEEDVEEDSPPKKKAKKVVPPPPDIDEEEFKALQEKLMTGKGQNTGSSSKGKKNSKTRKGR